MKHVLAPKNLEAAQADTAAAKEDMAEAREADTAEAREDTAVAREAMAEAAKKDLAAVLAEGEDGEGRGEKTRISLINTESKGEQQEL